MRSARPAPSAVAVSLLAPQPPPRIPAKKVGRILAKLVTRYIEARESVLSVFGKIPYFLRPILVGECSPAGSRLRERGGMGGATRRRG